MNRTQPTTDEDKFADLIGESFDRQPIPSRPSDQQTRIALVAKHPPVVHVHPSRWSHVLTSVPVIAVGILMAIVIWRVDLDNNTEVPKENEAIIAKQVEVIPHTAPAQQKPITSPPVDSPAIPESVDKKAEPELAKEVPKKVRYGLKKYDAKRVAEDLKALLKQHKAVVTADLQLNTVTILGTDDERQLAKEYIAQLHRNLKDQTEGDYYLPSIVSIIEYVRECIENQKADPQKLTLYLGPLLAENSAEKQVPLSNAFAALGTPKSIQEIQRGVSKDRSWLTTQDSYAYTFTMDYEHLWTDMEAFVDTAMGDKITQGMLDGIRDDEEGPKIDIRKIVKTLEEDFVFVVQASGRPGFGETVMVAISLTDTDLVTRAVEQAMAIEPDQTSTVLEGFVVYSIQHGDGPAHSICIANNCLVIGASELVHKSVQRLKNQ